MTSRNPLHLDEWIADSSRDHTPGLDPCPTVVIIRLWSGCEYEQDGTPDVSQDRRWKVLMGVSIQLNEFFWPRTPHHSSVDDRVLALPNCFADEGSLRKHGRQCRFESSLVAVEMSARDQPLEGLVIGQRLSCSDPVAKVSYRAVDAHESCDLDMVREVLKADHRAHRRADDDRVVKGKIRDYRSQISGLCFEIEVFRIRRKSVAPRIVGRHFESERRELRSD